MGVHGVAMQELVLVPGLGSDSAVWRRTVLELNGEVTCTVGDTLNDDSLHAMAQRILANAPRNFALAGVSMGGMVALEIMRIAPQRITRLALVDTRARPDTPAQKAYRHLANLLAGSLDYRRLSEFSMGSLVHSSAAPDIRAELLEMSGRVGAKTYIRQNRAVLARTDLRPILHQIAIPTAIVVGAEDRMTPVELSKEMHELIPGSSLRIINDCGHLPPIEKPEAMAGILLDLLGMR
jgi:pimeloyl-ACP methyl ester carboxylesterase